MLDDRANQLLEPYTEAFDNNNLETIKTLMYNLAYEAEKTGFILGVKTIIQIFIEIFTPNNN